MTIETVIMLLAFSIFALCSAIFITRATASSSFRNKIAAPRGFTEGAAIGIAYPLWIFSYGMLFVQCAAFMAFPTLNEIELNRRLLIFIVNLVVFFILRSKNLPLLAVWFGKTGIWISHGVSGLIKFENIISCEITDRKKFHSDDPNAMCTLTIYTKGRKRISRTEKYVCKLAANELTPYLSHLPMTDKKQNDGKMTSPIVSLNRLLTNIAAAITLFGAICFLFSTALLSPYTYTESETAEKTEYVTYAPITDALGENGMIVVRHEAIEAINVYSEESGELVWSLSRARDFFPDENDGISAANGVIKYTVGSSARYFRITDGTELSHEEVSEIEFPHPDALRAMDFEFHPLYIRKQLSDRSYKYTVNRPTTYTLFIPSFAWGMLIFGTVALYIFRMFSGISLNPLAKNDRNGERSSRRSDNGAALTNE